MENKNDQKTHLCVCVFSSQVEDGEDVSVPYLIFDYCS